MLIRFGFFLIISVSKAHPERSAVSVKTNIFIRKLLFSQNVVDLARSCRSGGTRGKIMKFRCVALADRKVNFN